MTQISSNRYKRIGAKGHVYAQDDGWYWDSTNSKPVLIIGNSVYAASGELLASDGVDVTHVAPSGDVTMSAAGVMAIGDAKVTNAMTAKPRLRIVREQLLASALTDGGAAVGTKTMSTAIAAGAYVLKTLVDTIVGFTGDTTAVLTLGDGTTANRYMTGSPSLFTTAAQGVDMGVVSGTAWHTAAKTLTATVTSTADITPVLASGGSCFVTIAFYEPV
jgi:hypothetical protein